MTQLVLPTIADLEQDYSRMLFFYEIPFCLKCGLAPVARDAYFCDRCRLKAIGRAIKRRSRTPATPALSP